MRLSWLFSAGAAMLGGFCGLVLAERFVQPDKPSAIEVEAPPNRVHFDRTHGEIPTRGGSRSEESLGMADKAQLDRGRISPSTMTKADLTTWVRDDPVAAWNWFLKSGWEKFGMNEAELRSCLQELASAQAEGYTARALSDRLGWTGAYDRSFALARKWSLDRGGNALAQELATNPQRDNLIWLVGEANPANSWPAMAEWVGTTNADPQEKGKVIEHLAQKAIQSGDAAYAVSVLGAQTDPVYERARGTLVAGLIGTNANAARAAWDSIRTPEQRLATFAFVMSSPQTSSAAREQLSAWAVGSGLPASVDKATWRSLVSKWPGSPASDTQYTPARPPLAP